MSLVSRTVETVRNRIPRKSCANINIWIPRIGMCTQVQIRYWGGSNLISVCVQVWGKVQNMSCFQVRRAWCPWTPQTPAACPLLDAFSRSPSTPHPVLPLHERDRRPQAPRQERRASRFGHPLTTRNVATSWGSGPAVRRLPLRSFELQGDGQVGEAAAALEHETGPRVAGQIPAVAVRGLPLRSFGLQGDGTCDGLPSLCVTKGQQVS